MSEPEPGKGAAGTRKQREGLERGRSQRGSMKEGCVRESVKGGVCKRHAETEKRHWRPVYATSIDPARQSGQLPRRQPEFLPCRSPPNTLSPSPSFGGEKNPVATAEKESKRKVGSLGPAVAWCAPSLQAGQLWGHWAHSRTPGLRPGHCSSSRAQKRSSSSARVSP